MHYLFYSFTLMQEQALLVKTAGKTKTSRLIVQFFIEKSFDSVPAKKLILCTNCY